MIIGYVQTEPRFGDKTYNFNQVRSLLDGVRADLLVLPELFATGYAFSSREEALELAEGADGPTSSFLAGLARSTGAVLVAGFAERKGEETCNSALVVGSSGVLAVYRKIHLFNREKLWFSPGDAPPPVVDLGKARVGIMICFDWFFPETARTLALGGADILAHPSNLVLPWCQQAMIIRCLENRVFAVTANRVGREARGEDDFTFTGRSQITSIKGEAISVGPAQGRAVRVVRIDPALAREKKVNAWNDLVADRRPDLYRLDGGPG